MEDLDLLSVLDQLGNPTHDLGGASNTAANDSWNRMLAQMRAEGKDTTPYEGRAPNSNSAIAALQMGGGSASIQGPDGNMVPMFGGTNPQAQRSALRPSLQEVLNSADQIATSLSPKPRMRSTGDPVSDAFYAVTPESSGRDPRAMSQQDIAAAINGENPQGTKMFGAPGAPQRQQLLANPYGSGSYDPNNPDDVAMVKAQQEQANKITKARDVLNNLALNPAFKGSQKEIVQGVLESLGLSSNGADKEYAKAKARAEGKAAGEGGGSAAPDDSIASKLASYSIPLPSGIALRTPYWQAQLKRAVELNPNFDAKEYKTRQAVMDDFGKGKAAINIRSLNTAVDHLQSLQSAGRALQNGDAQGLNAVVNKVREWSGDKSITDFKTAATAIESELASVFKGAGATDQEIKQWRERFSPNMSPAQMEGVIKEGVKLMAGRAGALGEQWRQTFKAPRDEAVLGPRAQETLRAMGIDPATADPTLRDRATKGAAPSGAPEGAQVVQGKTYQGKQVYRLPDGKLWVP